MTTQRTNDVDEIGTMEKTTMELCLFNFFLKKNLQKFLKKNVVAGSDPKEGGGKELQ